jgi:hypothetical protein
MIDHLVRDLQLLRKADLLIGKIWLEVFARRLGLSILAALIAVFGLGMANLAAYNALQAPLGPIWSAAAVALADILIAALVLQLASNARPGPEIELAFEMRRMGLDAIQKDAGDLKRAVDAIAGEVRAVKDDVAAVIHNPFDAAAQKLLIPAVLSVMKGLRAKKEHA